MGTGSENGSYVTLGRPLIRPIVKQTKWPALIPGFVVGFVAMAVVRLVGDATLGSSGAAFGMWNAASWASITKQLGDYWAS